MKIGIGLWGMQATYASPRHHMKLYDELVEDAAVAEKLGFDSIWLTEHHFWYDGYLPSLFEAAAAVAAVTSRIQIGTGTVLLPMHDPLRVAEKAAVVDTLSNGRLLFGVGVGYRDVEFDAFGIPRPHRGARFDEQLDILRLAWGEDSFSYQGKHYRYRNVSVTPKPFQKPLVPLVGGYGLRLAERAGGRGLGILPVVSAAQDFVNMRDLYQEEAAMAGADTTHAVMACMLSTTGVADSVEEALFNELPRARYVASEWQVGSWEVPPGLPGGKRQTRDEFIEMARTLQASLEQQNLIGTPARLVRGLKQFEAAGVQHLILRIRYDSPPRKQLHHQMELIARDVIPHFR